MPTQIGTITIAVNDKGYPVAGRSEGKKVGYAKSADTGKFISLKENLVDEFRKGGTFKFEFETFGQGGRIATKILEHTGGKEEAASNGAAPPVRARTAKEDEEQINERHRLTWVGERLDAVAAQLPLKFEEIWPVAEMFASIYDGLRFKERPVEEEVQEEHPPATKQAAYATGPAPGHDGMNDSIPFAPEFR